MTATPFYGITGFGGYIPRLRMQRTAIASAHKWMAPSLHSLAKGQRALCRWDEDGVTMAGEAARDALGVKSRTGIEALYLASTTMPFADMQNSAIMAGALDLSPGISTLDVGSSQRAATSALLIALKSASGPALFLASG